MSLRLRGYESGRDADLFLGLYPSGYAQSALEVSTPSNVRTLVTFQDLADPRCHYQRLRTLRVGYPTHDRYLPIPCSHITQ